MRVVGIRREDKSEWERRVPLVPEDVARLAREGVDLVVERSERRCIPEEAFAAAGARIVDDLSAADVILGVKEIPVEKLEPGKTYMYFSHTMKGQPYNMGMLATLLERRCTLLDYELVTDERGIRAIGFGRFAGLAGAIDTLWALGQRYESERVSTPFAAMRQSLDYADLAEAGSALATLGSAIRDGGLPEQIGPVAIAVTGEGGAVYNGAMEILEKLPARRVSPDELPEAVAAGERNAVLLVGYGPGDLVEPVSAGHSYSWEDYRDHPDRYRARFGRSLPHLTAIVHGILWSEGYPRFILRDDLAPLFANGERPRLRLVTDITCDLGGSNEALLRTTEPGDPTYVLDPATGESRPGFDGPGLVVLAVDILPAELPVDASHHFSQALAPFVPALAGGANPGDPSFPPELERSVIAARGELVPPWDERLAAPLREHADAGGHA